MKVGLNAKTLVLAVAVLGLLHGFAIVNVPIIDGIIDYGAFGDLMGGKTVSTGYSGYAGTMTIKANAYNYYDMSVDTMTSPAFFASHYSVNPSMPQGGISITYTGTSFDLLPEDMGKFWLKCDLGDVSFQLVDKMIAENPRIISSQFLDPDGDGESHQYILCDAGDIANPDTEKTPVFTVAIPDIDEDVSGVAISYVAGNQTVAGTGDNEWVLTAKLAGFSEGAGCAITEIYVSDNATTRKGSVGTAMEFSANGLGLQKSIRNPVKEDETGTAGEYTAWYLKVDDRTEWWQGWLISRGTNEADAMYLDLNYRVNSLGADDDLRVTLSIVYVDCEGSTTTISQEFQIRAD